MGSDSARKFRFYLYCVRSADFIDFYKKLMSINKGRFLSINNQLRACKRIGGIRFKQCRF